MFTYPEALNAMEKVAMDLFRARWPNHIFNVRVVADSVTGTASVDWVGDPRTQQYVRVTINMPIRAATYRMSAQEFSRWAAYLLHEVGHPNETDMSVWKGAIRAGSHKLLNALEDVREEKCTIDFGLAHNAVAVFSDLIDSLQAKAEANGYDPNAIQSIGWTLSLLGRHANGYKVDVSFVHAKLDPKGIVGSIVPWALEELAACKGTQDCLDLADKVIKAVNDARKAAKEDEPEVEVTDERMTNPEPQGGRGESHDDEPQPDTSPDVPEEPKEDDQQRGKAGDGGDKGKGDSDGKEEVEAKSPTDEAVEEPKAEEEKPFTDADIDEVDLKPNDRDDIVSSGAKAGTQANLVRVVRKLIVETNHREKPVRGRDVNGSVDVTIGNASKMGVQRALLARALKAEEVDSYEGGRRHGRLNGRALAKAAMGNTNVFGKRVISQGYDTDVQILVDGSGSMSGRRIAAASTLALVVAQAASQVGVDCFAHVFNDEGLHYATKGKDRPKGNKFAYMQNQIMGGTPLTENVLRVAIMQARRAGAKRKVLFVITDGDCDWGHDMVKAAGEYVETTHGTEIANLHIGRLAPGMFRNEVAVDAHNVSATGLKQLTAILERGL